MNRLLCLIAVFFNAIIFASTSETYLKFLNEKEPNNLFDECVNLVSGNFVFDDEVVIAGLEPIKLHRTYFSLNNFDKRSKDEKSLNEYIFAGWSYQNSLKAFLYKDVIEIVQPSGAVYSFKIPNVKESGKSKKDKKGKSDDFKNLEYKRTSYLPNFSYKQDVKLINPKNLTVKLKGQNELFVLYPDGTQKYYKKESDKSNEYLLRNKTLLNQNKMEYFYDGLNRITQIRSANPKGNKTYAWVKFNYFHSDLEYKDKHKDKYDFVMTSSDGKKYEFRHDNYFPVVSKKEKSEHPFFMLDQILSNQADEKFAYHLDYKRTHPLLKSVVLPNKITKEASYYLLGNKNPEVNISFNIIGDFRFERVKTLQEPVGINGSMVTTYRFIYDKASADKLANTTVYDSKNNKYVYYYNTDSKIEKIQRYENKNGSYGLLNEERYVWNKNNDFYVLSSKAFMDKSLKPVLAKRYFYDSNGSLTEEKIYGNISSNSPKLVLDDKNLPKDGCETFSKRYKYKNDLLIEENDDCNFKINYSYLPNTNILESKILSCGGQTKKRFFYEYNEDNQLIKEIEDDGSSLSKNDVSNLSYRKIRYYYLKAQEPFFGFVLAVEEKYLDLKTMNEKLLKKEAYTYLDTGKIIKKDVYDENNNYASCISYEYDAKGNLISETNPLDKKTIYQYDGKNNKIKEIYPNGKQVFSAYNLSNQIINREIQKEGEKTKLQYFYDVNKNNTAFMDDQKNETKYEYDNFSNLTKQIMSKPADSKSPRAEKIFSCDEQGNISRISQNGNVTEISYNIFSKPISIVYLDKTQERFIYNLDGTLKVFIDKQNIRTEYGYDYLKRVISKAAVSPDGKILRNDGYMYNSFAVKEEKNKKHAVKYYYDFAQRLAKKEIIAGGDVYTEEYFYDNLSRKNKTVYNSTFAEISHKDLSDREILLEKTSLDGTVFYKKEFKYDDLDNLSIVSYIDDKQSIENHAFDSFERIAKIKDAFGNETTYRYENSFINPNLKINETDKKAAIDEKIVLLEKRGSDQKVFFKEENSFDALNNLLSRKISTCADGMEKKKEIFYSYDTMNRLAACLEKENDFQKETKFTYIDGGLVKSIIKPDKVIIEKQYDDFGNVCKISSSDKKCEYLYEYNNFDLPVKIIDLVNNTQIDRKYNSFGKLIEEKLANDLVLKKQYDLLGRKTAVIYPDNSSVKYSYDPYNLQIVIRQNPLGQNRYYHEYLKYDLSGNVLQEKLLGNLGIAGYTLDLLGKNESIQTPYGFEKALRYDPAGRVEKRDWKIFYENNNADYYRDDLLNQVYSRQSKNAKYDLNGNLVYEERGNSKIFYEYDCLNRLLLVQKDDCLAQFTYDGLNRKAVKNIYKLKNEDKDKELISTIRYLYDEEEEIGAYDQKDEAIELKILGREANKPFAVAYELSSEVYAPLYDIFGNVASLVSLNQGWVMDYKYSFLADNIISLLRKFGKTSAFSNPFRFFDKRLDKNINLYYLDTVFYNPGKDRMLNYDLVDILLKNNAADSRKQKDKSFNLALQEKEDSPEEPINNDAILVYNDKNESQFDKIEEKISSREFESTINNKADEAKTFTEDAEVLLVDKAQEAAVSNDGNTSQSDNAANDTILVFNDKNESQFDKIEEKISFREFENTLNNKTSEDTAVSRYVKTPSIDEGEQEETSALNIRVNNPFKGIIFDIFSSVASKDHQKENFKISKEAVAFLAKENIPLSIILEGIKKTNSIEKINDSEFYVTYKNLGILIDLRTKEIMSIEKI